ncbi:MAG TPA: glycosyltransferase [Thermoanaerobaculia bacterium]|nr:glycosyltransferase [Thermoanaerobaculia bacterium]
MTGIAPHSGSGDRLPEVSVIVPAGRDAPWLKQTLDSLLAQKTQRVFEIVVVGDIASQPVMDPRIIRVEFRDLNPAARRNAGASQSRGAILGFIDDDATADPDWIERACLLFAESTDTLALGGPDPAPVDSPSSELLSETLLATPLIGSGIAAHENRQGTFRITSPHDLALVNLFVKRERFEAAGGFDETIGYIGEDTALLAKLIQSGTVLYSSDVVVRHRRRPFPGPYLLQRWKYRLKGGRMFARGIPAYRKNRKVAMLLTAGTTFLVVMVLAPPLAAVLLAIYLSLTFFLGVRVTRLPIQWWPLIPIAFLAHHTTYFFGIVTGIVSEALRTRISNRPPS